MNKNNFVKKGLVFAVIVLFVGVGIVPGISSNITTISKDSSRGSSSTITTRDNTGWHSPTATGDNHNDWTDPTNAYTSNDAWATAHGTMLYQDYYNFDLGVPANAVNITGIAIKIEGHGEIDGSDNIRCGLRSENWVPYKWADVEGWITLGDGVDIEVIQGGLGDTWGESWVPDDFTNTNFRVRIFTWSNPDKLSVDHIQAKVYYEVNNPPYQPSNPDPEDGATDVPVDADLSWTGGDPDGDTVTYDVYFGTSSPPPKVADNQTNTTYDPGTMNYSTMYYWQIVAWDEYGLSNTSDEWEFTTEESPNQPPYQPSNPSPANGSTDIPVDADLSWTGGDPDGDTVTYDVYFGTSSPPPQVAWNQSGTTYDPGTMNYEMIYYWRIVSWDNHGASTEGPVWSFATRGNNPPEAPIINGQTSGTAGEQYSYTFVSEDLDGDDVYYYIDWGDGSVEDWFGPYPSDEQIIANHSWSEKGTYTIMARAKDVYGAIGEWGTLEVTMPKNKALNFNFNLLSWLFERFPNMFPILRHLLEL